MKITICQDIVMFEHLSKMCGKCIVCRAHGFHLAVKVIQRGGRNRVPWFATLMVWANPTEDD